MNANNIKHVYQALPANVQVDIQNVNARLFMALDELQNEAPDLERLKALIIAAAKQLPYSNYLELQKYN